MNTQEAYDQVISKVTEYIKEKHGDQKRWDGSPYYLHPVAVKDIAVDYYTSQSTYRNIIDSLLVAVISLLHDAPEDVEGMTERICADWVKENCAIEVKNLLKHYDLHSPFGLDGFCSDIENALTRLNKNNYDNYLDFILGAKEFYLSRYVKLADITHNLTDLKMERIRDKYMLAKYILEN